jgi:hypothetical protein
MKQSARPSPEQQSLLDGIQIRLLDPAELPRCEALLAQHHYLGALQPVGERLHYAVTDRHGDWLGVLVFCAAARRLRPRDQWIGWSEEQRRRRLALVVSNTRFLLLPDKTVPNLASKTLRLALARLSDDWQLRYGHPVLIVETFVDPARFSGTLYTASGWSELGQTDGYGRKSRDYYVRHDQPKRLFCRELIRHARRSLQAEHLKPGLAAVEAKVPRHPTQTAPQLQSLMDHFKAVSDYRARIGFYPLWSLLAIVASAHLADAPRGQKDLAAFAQRLSQRQRHALGIRKNRRTGKCPAPSQPTFCRLYAQVDALEIERAVLAFQRQVRGAPPDGSLIVLDGKAPRHTGGQHILTAVTVPGQQYLGSAMVADKSNEIPAARELFSRLDLDGQCVSLDALHTQSETARALVLEHGADYLFTVKGNQPTVKENLERLVTPPPVAFPPCTLGDPGPHRGTQQKPG